MTSTKRIIDIRYFEYRSKAPEKFTFDDPQFLFIIVIFVRQRVCESAQNLY